ncbi:MAG: UDP-2,3-diacylglucosamine diphosphatase [Candidatus Absconditicoccaceae bacterium]
MQYKTIIISDVHLGTKDSRHQRVLDFLQKNKCENLILNGDIVDGRHIKIFGGRPKGHTDLIHHIIDLAKSNQTKVFYIPGNHDDFLRNLLPIKYGDINFLKDMIYHSGNKKYYICHGDRFDRIEGKLFFLGTISFLMGSFVFMINRIYNRRREKRGLKYFSLVKQIKLIVKIMMTGGSKRFEKKLIKAAKQNNCEGIICGHIHKQENKMLGNIHYLNSGDRVESCTALVEDFEGNWDIHYHKI